MPAAILYLGPLSGTCQDRAQALRRLGCEVTQLDLRTLLPATPWVDRITWRLGGHLFSALLLPRLRAALGRRRFDLCYVDGGEWVTPAVIGLLRQHCTRVINYNIDDPLGPRDGARFAAYRSALPHYDLVAVVREENVAEARALGAREVLRVWRSADEISHAPRPLSAHDHQQWDSEVLVLGTWFPQRDSFMLALLERGVPLTLRGANWHKAPEWPRLRAHWRGGQIGGDDYARAIQCARINLGLLSQENRDLHTTRSLEIPALGSLLCAQRTSEHSGMYREGEEAVFWSDAAECAAVCHQLLDNDARRSQIARNGHQRVKLNGHYNEMVLSTILAAAQPHP